jgi:hypothetical protein
MRYARLRAEQQTGVRGSRRISTAYARLRAEQQNGGPSVVLPSSLNEMDGGRDGSAAAILPSSLRERVTGRPVDEPDPPSGSAPRVAELERGDVGRRPTPHRPVRRVYRYRERV